MPERDWTTISLPKEVVERIKRIMEEKPDLGYRSVADFVLTAVRNHPDFMERFEHYNVYDDHVTVFDREAKTLIDVYFRHGRVFCEFCEEFDCDHIRFALSLPTVVEALEEKGWIIREGRVLHPNY